MPQQITRDLAAILCDSEVVVWEQLEKYFLEQKIVQPYVEGSTTLPTRRMLRELMRMAALQLPTVISSTLAESLAGSPPAREKPAKWDKPSVSKSAKPKQIRKKGTPKPTHRIAWDRPWTPPAGAKK